MRQTRLFRARGQNRSLVVLPCFGAAVAGTHAYAASLDSLYVIDVSNPSNPTIVGTVGCHIIATGVGKTGVAVAGSYAYVACAWHESLLGVLLVKTSTHHQRSSALSISQAAESPGVACPWLRLRR
jgi:hypothetical protein